MQVLLFALLLAVLPSASAATVTNISNSQETVAPLLPGLEAPAITLKNNQGKAVDLAKLYQNKTTLVVVYRGGWCPYCVRQLNGIQKIEPQLKKLGVQIVAISPDSPQSLAKSTIESPNYMLLSDAELAYSQALGLAYYLDDKTAKAYRNKLGVNFVDLDGKDRVALPVPAVFVIDKKGLIQFQYANPNYKVRLDENVLLAAATAASKL
ncbi:AhpC/TSA family protein [Pseudoalteromonas luteoviolacea]|uniref:peroxiredoxin-like family protein n=1 Tax=Pseudoalteromonas luteoviolacea TaxID=43657 RepID=UPI001B39FDE2|nr:peroxiredoxin-like family protein [Pseudoalteromonas luteoviolacea]MBQ4879482.1 AhpC/TSA family protein [Pseudoalteromonas luteoviolacea]MBQ4908591.1 AhpC/TSA family protein [Pseudoalteromonas luteoviolacea]